MVGWCSIGTFNDPWTTWDLRPSGIENTCLLLICFLLCWATCREHPRAMMCLFNQIIQIQYDWIQPPKIKVMMMMFISHHCSSIWFLIAIMAQKRVTSTWTLGFWWFWKRPGNPRCHLIVLLSTPRKKRLIWGVFRSWDPWGFRTPAAMWKGRRLGPCGGSADLGLWKLGLLEKEKHVHWVNHKVRTS